MDHLIARLIACRDFLRQFDEQWWSDKMSRLADSSLSQYDRALTVDSWCGGMGSLIDLVIHPMNQHRLTDEEIDPVNKRWINLLSDLLMVTDAIIKGHERNQH